jgi:O-methyltransferase
MSTVKHIYKRPLIVPAGKSLLSSMEKVLPRKAFVALYDFSLLFYRELLRFLYLRFWLWSVLNNNVKPRLKVATIFKVMPYSLVGWRGLEATYDVVLKVRERRLSGSIVECGVAKGGSAALMALLESEASPRRKIWLFDSYEGLPEPTEEDFIGGVTGSHINDLSRGSCLGTYNQVADLLFRRFRLNRNNILMVKGWFQDTLPANRGKIGLIALLRIDADWYESVKCCLENLYDQVLPGGYVIIDDYGSCFGAQKAVDEFLDRRNLKVELFHDGRGGCHFVKPA